LELKAHPPAGEPRQLRVEESGSSSGKAPEGPSRKEHRFQYTPRERGDHILTAEARPEVEERDRQIVKDHAKVVLHVLSQNGWDRAVGQPLEVVPLTRPYGLRAGSAFHARVLLRGKPLEGAQVEIEKMNPAPPGKDLPEDEFITRTARTAPDGTLITSLDAKGWWAILVKTKDGKETVNGTEYSVELRSTLWVYVGEPLRRSGSD
jgi:cobalt/nickel transport protein